MSNPVSGIPMPFEVLTKVEGPIERHIEALWSEVSSLKEQIIILKAQIERLRDDHRLKCL